MKIFLSKLRDYTYYFAVPLLVGIYPALFHYANNSDVILINSLGTLLLLFIGISIFVFVIFLFIYKFHLPRAALAASLFLVFFHTYGIVFNQLQLWDVFTVEHYMILPVYILLAAYFIWIVGRIDNRFGNNPWKIVTVILLGLVMLNAIKILPVEIKKITIKNSQEITTSSNQIQEADQSYPDIYYVIFDEMVGFDAIRYYWNHNEINKFVAYLESRGFYVAENSNSSTTNTFHEIAERLNYELYPYDPSDYKKYWDEDLDHISSNRVFAYLKTKGYSIAVFEDGLPLSSQFNADVVYLSALNETLSWGSIYDEFGMLVLKNTMIEPFIDNITQDRTATSSHGRMLIFTAEQVNKLEIGSPKFVYIHLLIPHMPFLFDANGKRISLRNQNDWDQYLGYYIFSTQYAQSLLDKILSSTDNAHQPIIIFQSDHGARNIKLESANKVLENYPTEYQTLIVNTLKLPGCKDALLTQDMDPINTFPTIFNCYFNANIPLK